MLEDTHKVTNQAHYQILTEISLSKAQERNSTKWWGETYSKKYFKEKVRHVYVCDGTKWSRWDTLPTKSDPKGAKSCSTTRGEVKASNKQQKSRVEIPPITSSELAQNQIIHGKEKKSFQKQKTRS